MAKRGRPKKNVEKPIETKTEPIDETVEDIASEEVSDDVEKEFQETEKDDIKPTQDKGMKMPFNPLAESVTEMEYAEPKIAEGVVEEIGEPSFDPPTYDDLQQQDTEEDDEGEDSPFDNPNPALNDLDEPDKKIACESMVEAVLDGYESLHKVAQNYVNVSEEELLEMQMKGKIDMNQIIPVSADGLTTMTIQEFVMTYNDQSVEALTLDSDFREKVKPPMVRVFMKRGWGMTDEQFLAYMFGKDLITKASIVYGLKKTMTTTLTMLSKAHTQNKGSAPTPPKPPAPTNTAEEVELMDDDEEVSPIPKEEKRSKSQKGDDFSGTTKRFDINQGENPLREKRNKDIPPAKVINK